MLPWVIAGAAGGLLYLIRKRAAPQEQQEQSAQPEPRRALPRPTKPPTTPLAGVTPDKWKAFMLAIGDRDNHDAVSTSGHFGFFRFGMPRLADLGLACNVRRDDKDGKRIWAGDFVPPLTRDGFLGDLPLQCRVFGLSCGDYATHLADNRAADIGCSVDGATATLSGLLGVLHRAGIQGYEKWITKPGDRKRYPHTTAAFKSTNGMF